MHGRQKLALPFFLTLLRAGSDQAVGYCSLLPNKIGKHKQGTVTRRKCDSWGRDEQNLSKIQELKGKPLDGEKDFSVILTPDGSICIQ